MSKQISQFRFYSPAGPYFLDTNISGADLISGTSFQTKTIYQLGIQSIPGTKFILGKSNSSSPVTIGSTGIFEMDFNNFASKPVGLSILPSSIKNIINNPIGYIIIDLVYEEGSES